MTAAATVRSTLRRGAPGATYLTAKVVDTAQGSFVMLGTMFTFSLLNELGWPFCVTRDVSRILYGRPVTGGT